MYVCSTHVLLVTGHNADPDVVFQVHQHSLSLDLSHSKAEKLQDSAGCLSENNQIVSGFLWLLFSSEKHLNHVQ